ncbi:MAG: dUTP diphosphatase [Deltaproteobacteria bacterium]|nr:dUTP diphosphatase [Deltaproteobacteria bacterium]MBW1874483.1 dUTP diphosphatase [Deltaproteobacteria bacterium]MBW2209875.1 dUTP diphosphatase [Deltaproteobacteria bacterium]MBW2549808.1 dUTP diphosphatase [Deltaproteobacteria bacterium]MBW2626851.1 dUTP diphosphatase [Deltaproteobacteria bacterium]
MATLRVHRMRADAVVPRYKTSGAAGMDLAACLATPLTIPPGGVARVPTGLQIALPTGHEGQVRPRSGLAARHAVTVLNAPGTIDEDYRGEVQVLLINHGSEAFTIESGDRIAQLIVTPVTQAEIEVVEDEAALGDTERGDGGFGSTGR